MKIIIILLFLCICIVSCTPEPEEPNAIVFEDSCTVEVKLRSCPTLNCLESENIAGKIVEVYEDYNEAIEGANPMFVDSTNHNGWVKFYDLTCIPGANVSSLAVTVRIDLGVNGVFIGNANFFVPNQKFDVTIFPNYYYDFNQLGQPIVEQVSLEFPTIGQFSNYEYFERSDVYTFGEQFISYSNVVNLSIYITNQVGPNIFYVSEYLNNADNTNLPSLNNGLNQFSTESIWRIESDTVFVSNLNPINGVISIIWNVTEDEELINGEYAIPLINNSSNFLEMDGDFEMPVPDWNGVGGCSDFQSLNFLFNDLLVEKRNYADSNGPLKYLVFTPKFGVVRSLYYSDATNQYTSGFDLIVN